MACADLPQSFVVTRTRGVQRFSARTAAGSWAFRGMVGSLGQSVTSEYGGEEVRHDRQQDLQSECYSPSCLSGSEKMQERTYGSACFSACTEKADGHEISSLREACSLSESWAKSRLREGKASVSWIPRPTTICPVQQVDNKCYGHFWRLSFRTS